MQISKITTGSTNTRDPAFNQDFVFSIQDTKNARLDCTIWDSNISITEDKGFLGEVRQHTIIIMHSDSVNK